MLVVAVVQEGRSTKTAALLEFKVVMEGNFQWETREVLLRSEENPRMQPDRNDHEEKGEPRD